MKPRIIVVGLSALLATTLAKAQTSAGAAAVPRVDEPGSISGFVSSASTGSMLQGASVEIPSLNRRVLTDNGGRFVLSGLPWGTHEVVVTYTGLKADRRSITLRSGPQVPHAIELATEDIIAMEKYTVASEREGNALAVTSQRNAPNVKNVVSFDAFGTIPNMGVGELLLRLPGVAPVYDPQGRVGSVSVRGMPAAMTSTTIDGNPAFRGNGARTTGYIGLVGAFMEQVELTKGHTPDQSANSLGGSVNLRTASPLTMKEKRRFSYNTVGRWAPSFFDHSPERLRHPVHPLINLGYQEAFDVAGDQRNLGVSFGIFYSENTNDGDAESYNHQNTLNSPAFIHDYRSVTNIVNKHIGTANLKVEYRPSAVSKFSFGALYNVEVTPAATSSELRAFTSQTIATLDASGQPVGVAGAILPGFTENRTQVRALPASVVQITNSALSFYAYSPSLSFNGEHKLANWDLDYRLAHTSIHIDRGSGKQGGEAGELSYSVPNIGWIIDRRSPAAPTFTQTQGPSIYELASYTTGTARHTNRDEIEQNSALNAGCNAAYRFATVVPLTLKAGLAYEQRINDRTSRNSRQWTRATGRPPLPDVPVFVTMFETRNGRHLPAVDARESNKQLSDAALWTEDLYYNESQKLSQTKYATEEIYGGFAMLRSQLTRLGVLAGVRTERTDVTGEGHVRRRPATAAQMPDPVARARYDWGVAVKNRGSYTRSFPSIHLNYDLTTRLKARASWSTGFGRPSQNVLVPNATANDAAQTLTVANPGLGPQYARNADLSLEYYFKPAGLFTIGYFSKKIEDYILASQIGVVDAGPNNGYAGDYSGYALISQTNAGTATAKGWELDYRQQFTFLPGWLKGLQLAANYTTITTEGDFGTRGAKLRNKEVAGFVPRTYNVNLGYTYGRFGTRVTYNNVSDNLRTFNANPALRYYTSQLEYVQLGFSYRWRPSVIFAGDLTNVFGARREVYQYLPSRSAEIRTPNQTISLGVSGRF